MAYLNEFPHMEANKLNLDWLLEQYSTFNKRIKEIQDHFDEVAAEMAGEVNQLEQDFDEFKQTVNTNFSNLSHDIEVQVNAAIADIQRQIDTISNNMAAYIEAHMEEWQAEAIYKAFIIDNNNWTTASAEDITAPDTFENVRALVGNPNYKFVLKYAVEGVMSHLCELTCVEESSSLIVFVGHFYNYQVRITLNDSDIVNLYEVQPTTFLTKNNYNASAATYEDFDSDGVLTNDSGYTLPKGTWLVVGNMDLLAAASFEGNYAFSLDKESNITEIVPVKIRGNIEGTGTEEKKMNFCGVYSSTGTNNIKLRCKLLMDDDAPASTNFATLVTKMEFIKI